MHERTAYMIHHAVILEMASLPWSEDGMGFAATSISGSLKTFDCETGGARQAAAPAGAGRGGVLAAVAEVSQRLQACVRGNQLSWRHVGLAGTQDELINLNPLGWHATGKKNW